MCIHICINMQKDLCLESRLYEGCMMKPALLRTSFVSKPQGQLPELCSVGGGGLDDLVVFHGKSENPYEMRVFFLDR